jgi:hypothetical protein
MSADEPPPRSLETPDLRTHTANRSSDPVQPLARQLTHRDIDIPRISPMANPEISALKLRQLTDSDLRSPEPAEPFDVPLDGKVLETAQHAARQQAREDQIPSPRGEALARQLLWLPRELLCHPCG